MGMNPFGEESDSVHAWKERYKQLQFQNQTLLTQLGEIKSRQEELQIKFEETNRQLREREEELSEAKQDYRELRELTKDKDNKLSELETKTDLNTLEKLESENKRLVEDIEELRSQIIRGGGESHQTTSNAPSQITTALIPLMLHEYDPGNPAYQNAFINLVETIIEEGDVLARIIGILVKYGGQGPYNKVKAKIASEDFEVALELLMEEEVITVVDQMIYLSSQKGIAPSNAWDTIETGELFDLIASIAEKKAKKELIKSMQNFFDVLQSRQIPLTTIFFEIRKTIERIEKDRIERKDVISQIHTWKAKFEALS